MATYKSWSTGVFQRLLREMTMRCRVSRFHITFGCDGQASAGPWSVDDSWHLRKYNVQYRGTVVLHFFPTQLLDRFSSTIICSCLHGCGYREGRSMVLRHNLEENSSSASKAGNIDPLGAKSLTQA